MQEQSQRDLNEEAAETLDTQQFTALAGEIVALLGYIASFFAGVIGVLSSIVTSLPFILIAMTFSLVFIPWVYYHDVAIEEAELFMRGTIYPLYRDTIRGIMDLFRQIWNYSICYINAGNWLASGILREAILPTAKECNNLKQLFITLADFVLAVLKDFLLEYFLMGRFYTSPMDFTNICNKFVLFWDQWIQLYTCSCNDLGMVLADLPIIPSFAFSAQWKDPQLWCAISDLTNAVFNLLSIVLRLIQQILQAILAGISPQSPYAQVNFTRPDFYPMLSYICNGVSCFMRSFENAMNRFWNNYIPFPFNFTDYFCIVDTSVCIFTRSVNWLLTLIVNIDRVISYPTNPFYDDVMKPLTFEILNLIAAPTQWAPVVVPESPLPTRFTLTNYYISTNDTATPRGTINPLYGKKRLSECLCIFITRTVCDPSNTTTACFSVTAASILNGFDFCCATNSILTLGVDTLSALSELTYHVSDGATPFMLFMDEQPFTSVLTLDLVEIVRCLVSVFRLIPQVGIAVQNLLTELARWALSTIEFLGRVLVGLASLPYFLIEIPGTPNFITTTNEALMDFVAIQERLIAQIPESAMNSLCILLNNGFPIPPPPCSTCSVGGFIPLPPGSRRRTFTNPETGKRDSPWTLVAEVMGWSNPESAYLVTPIIYYQNHTTNPLELAERIRNNNGDVSQYIPNASNMFDRAKKRAFRKWGQLASCNELRREELELKETRPHIWRYNKQRGKYDCKLSEHPTDVKRSTNVTLPTIPVLATCGPTPPLCYDLCCAFRSSFEVIVHAFSFAARFFNGFVQFMASQQGTAANFPYFTGEFCKPPLNQPCFESDLVMLILKLAQVANCLCNFLNTVVAYTPLNPRQDLCCFIQRAVELVVCLLMIIINGINSVALGAQDNYSYFRDGLFVNDVDAWFDIAVDLLNCLCDIMRATFPTAFIPGLKEIAAGFDICCFPKAIVETAIEILRTVTVSIISLATITVTPSSVCYFRLDLSKGCSGVVDEIGLVKDLDKIIDTLLPLSDVGTVDSCQANCGNDQGTGGIAPCICQLFNTLIPFRTDPSLPVNCTIGNLNCQQIDLCCPFVKIGISLNLLTKVTNRMLVNFWQPWTSGIPNFFVNYLFCDETNMMLQCGGSTNACAYDITRPRSNSEGTFTCAVINPIIDSITNASTGLISDCLCELVKFLDILLIQFFDLLGLTWQSCFCGETTGIFRFAADFADVVLTQVVRFIRLAPLPCFWKPAGQSILYFNNAIVPPGSCSLLTPGCECRWQQQQITSVQQSWIYSVLGPIVNAMCRFVGSTACFFNSLFGVPTRCLPIAARGMGGVVAWIGNLIFRIGAFIEGFIRQFTDPNPTCVGDNPFCNAPDASSSYQGLSSNPLANILTSLLSYPGDAFIGDSRVACTRICPRGTLYDPALPSHKCGCYRLSPNSGGFTSNGTSIWADTGSDCFVAYPAVIGNVAYINSKFPLGSFHPYCASVFDLPFNPQNTSDAVCAKFNLCRPDDLPNCDSTTGSPEEIYTNFSGPLDGNIMALLRYMACAIPNGRVVLGPVITFLSYMWQLYGAVIRFAVTFILLLLSLFNLGSGCGCWDFNDPLQQGSTVHFSQGQGVTAGFCYECPDANAQCGDVTTLICEPHCPVFTITVGACENYLRLYSDPDNWPRNFLNGNRVSATDLCSGAYSLAFIDSYCVGFLNLNNTTPQYIQCVDDLTVTGAQFPYYQSICWHSYCLTGQPGVIKTGNFKKIGSIRPKNPKVLCSSLTLLDNIIETFNAFKAIFQTPLIKPDQRRSITDMMRKKTYQWTDIDKDDPEVAALKVKHFNKTFYNPEVLEELERIREKRSNTDSDIPSAPEIILAGLYDYDTSDCFSDPVSCVCRNIYMPEYCTWSPDEGVIPNLQRSLRWKHPSRARDHSVLETHEIMGALTEKFIGTGDCDHTIVRCGTSDPDVPISNTTMELWVRCVDKRVQGERLRLVTNGLFNSDYYYNHRGPIDAINNAFNRFRDNLKRRNLIYKDRLRERQSENRFPNLGRDLHAREQEGKQLLVEKYRVPRDSPIISVLLQADAAWFKYESGYYSWLAERFGRALETGDYFFPDTESALEDFRMAVLNLHQVVSDQPYKEMYADAVEAIHVSVRWTRDVLDYGVANYIRDVRAAFTRTIDERKRNALVRREETMQMIRRMPIYTWWSSASSDTSGWRIQEFIDHVYNAITHRRENFQTQDFSFWSADLHFRAARNAVVAKWTEPQWTPQIRANWDRIARVYYSLYNSFYPGQLDQERFVFGGNCRVLTRAAEVTSKVVNYCAVEYDPTSKRIEPVKRHHKRTGTLPNISGPAGFSFVTWFVDTLTKLFGIMFNVNAPSWVESVRHWLTNPNSDESDWPDVGLRYWLIFPLRCEFQDNLDCKKGAGLLTGLIWVTVGVAAAIVIGVWLFPPILWITSLIPLAFIWLIGVGVVSFHYSPYCFFLFPSLTGFSVTLPMCAANEIMAITDKYITDCYSPLLIPASMIAGEVCPTDPTQYIDFINCGLVGVSDGLQNLIFLGTVTLGSWFTDVLSFFVGNVMSIIFPGAETYIQTTLDGFKMASETQRERQWICFGMTAGMIALPVSLGSLGLLAFGLLIPLFIYLLVQLWRVVLASPIADVLPGMNNNVTAGIPQQEESVQEITPESVQRWIVSRGIVK